MGLAAGGTAGTLLGVEITGTEAAADPPLGLLVAVSAAAALVASRRTSRVGWGRSLALGYVLGAILRPLPQDQKITRPVHHGRGVRLRCHGTPDGEAVGACLRFPSGF